jgi:hypothetical protein
LTEAAAVPNGDVVAVPMVRADLMAIAATTWAPRAAISSSRGR